MLRLFQFLIGLIALGFEVVGIAYFVDWFGKTDWLMGHTYGPASSLIAALWTASVGVIGTGIWIAIALFRRRESLPERPEKRRRWLAVVQGALLILLLGPAGIIVAVGVAELPRAGRELQAQRIKAGDASLAELVEALRSPEPRGGRFLALQKLEEMGPGAKAAVPDVARLLQHPAYSSHAAKVLAAIGPQAEPAIPALVQTIKLEKGKRSGTGSDTPSTLSWQAGRALTEIGPASIPELLALLDHEDRYVRMTAVSALGNMGPQARDAVPAIDKVFNDGDELVRQWARVALQRIENQQSSHP